MSIFLAGPVGEMSKSKMSIGRPRVVHALGICERRGISLLIAKPLSLSLCLSFFLSLSPPSERAHERLLNTIKGGAETKEGRTHVDDAGDMALDRRTTQQQIDLIVIVSKPAKILDDAQRGLAIGHRRVHVVLLPVLVDAEAFKGQVAAGAELGFYGPLLEDGRFHAEVRHPVFHHREFERDDAGHLDGAAEGDLAVAL